MPELTTSKLKLHSDHALLCLLGHKCQQLKLLEPLHQLVKIDQKTVVHSPCDKLQDCLISILMGNATIYETNTTLSTDQAAWLAFGRTACADQSGIQRTLEACSSENVAQIQRVNQLFLASQGQTFRHDYTKGPLVIDIDLTGLPCSKHAEAASKGYFANCKPGTTGRQLSRSSVTGYNEILYQQVFPGNTGSAQLEAFKQVLSATWSVLELGPEAKKQVLIRLDGGYGTTEILNYLLAQGYQFVVKLFSSSRAARLCQSVKEWQSDQCHARQYAQLELPADYLEVGEAKLVQIGVRCLLKAENKVVKPEKGKKGATEKPSEAKESGQAEAYSYNVLVIRRRELAEHLEGPFKAQILMGQLHFYDQRAGMESASFGGDKQGLKLVKRRKHSLIGQEMLIQLAQLAHNLIVWLRNELSKEEAKVAEYGIKRMVRDWLGMSGRITFKGGQIVKVRFSGRHEIARQFFEVLHNHFAQSGVRLILHQT